MKILLDTQALILAGRGELPKTAAHAFSSPEHDVYFSLVSLWEIGIKAALKKIVFKKKLSTYHAMLTQSVGLRELPMDVAHIEKAVSLPDHHRDPFDRLLIGQALCEGYTVMSSDRHFQTYGCTVIWD